MKLGILKEIVTNLTNQKVGFVLWANGSDFENATKAVNHYRELAMKDYGFYGDESQFSSSEGWEIDVDFALELTGENKDVILLEFTETLHGE